MGLFSSTKATLAAQKLAEEHLYELAAEEIAANNIRPGLYAKALAETDGNEDAARARYIKLRVETMKAEADLQDYAASQSKTELHQRKHNQVGESKHESRDGFGLFLLIVVSFLFLAFLGG